MLLQLINKSKEYFKLFTKEEEKYLNMNQINIDYGTELCQEIIGKSNKNVHQLQLLEALQLGSPNDENSLFRKKLDVSFTTAGRITLWNWLQEPLLNKEGITERKMIKNKISSNEEKLQEIRKYLQFMENGWHSLCWCWSCEKSKIEVMRNVEFDGMMTPLNEIPVAQNTYHHLRVVGMPALQLFTPLVPIIISYLMLRFSGAKISFKECWDISSGVLKNALWWNNSCMGGSKMILQIIKWGWYLIFFINVGVMIYHSYRHFKLLSHVYEQTYQSGQWIITARQLLLETELIQLEEDESLKKKLELISNFYKNWTSLFSVFTNSHPFIKVYRLLRTDEIQNYCKLLLKGIGTIDALQSIQVLKRRDNYTEPIIVANKEPILKIEEGFHPLLSETQSKNSTNLNKNIVLTGANGSGKSTYIKTIILNVLLAQSWGISCSKKMEWTPFSQIKGFLLTPDDCGKESLFQAQIRRIEEYIQEVKQNVQSQKRGFSLLVVDEILNSTNPLEAMLLSYTYAKQLGKLTDLSRTIVTTHYPMLTTLCEKSESNFENWCTGKNYTILKNSICYESSAIPMVKEISKVLEKGDHVELDKAYKRLYKKLIKMQFKKKKKKI
tara:strand:+ start:1404 stop:3236 length:1833 start_codon:yes stop_codon:yes gene_type:complete